MSTINGTPITIDEFEARASEGYRLAGELPRLLGLHDVDDGFPRLNQLGPRAAALVDMFCAVWCAAQERSPLDIPMLDRMGALIRFYIHAHHDADRIIPQLERAVAVLTRERDDARAQLQAIGRKAFWAAKPEKV